MHIRRLYQLAHDFIGLPSQFKFLIAIELDLVDADQAELYSVTEELEDYVWDHVCYENLIDEFELLIGHYGGRGV